MGGVKPPVGAGAPAGRTCCEAGRVQGDTGQASPRAGAGALDATPAAPSAVPGITNQHSWSAIHCASPPALVPRPHVPVSYNLCHSHLDTPTQSRWDVHSVLTQLSDCGALPGGSWQAAWRVRKKGTRYPTPNSCKGSAPLQKWTRPSGRRSSKYQTHGLPAMQARWDLPQLPLGKAAAGSAQVTVPRAPGNCTFSCGVSHLTCLGARPASGSLSRLERLPVPFPCSRALGQCPCLLVICCVFNGKQ